MQFVQNSQHGFCRHQQAYAKIYMEREKSENSQNNLKKDKALSKSNMVSYFIR